MLWEADGKKLKSIINDIEAYQNMIEPFKNAEVLYIDDLFKPTKDKDGQIAQPTSGDIKLAYEIINHRYQKPGSITIISSERHISEIIELDNAVGSRIYEMTKQNAYNISKDADRNYRIRDMKVIEGAYTIEQLAEAQRNMHEEIKELCKELKTVEQLRK